MQFGHLMLCDQREGISSQVRYQQMMDEVRLMDSLGYQSVWFAEHHFDGYALIPDALLACAAAARETQNILLGAGVVVLPFHHPIRVAEQAAMVDCLSGGRLLLGVGRGYQPHEFAGFGQTLDESQERYDQALAVLVRALKDRDFSYDSGGIWRGERVTTWPNTVQESIPMWGAAISEASFQRFGKLGWPVLSFPSSTPPEKLKQQFDLYRETYLKEGHPSENMRIAATMFTFVSRNAEEANLIFERAMGKYFGHLDGLTRSAEAEQRLYDRLPTTARLSGSPSQVIKSLGEIRDYLGITDVINVTHFAGDLTHEQTLESIELFAREVIPAFSEK
ncbi:MAG TPA: LLM class flavin-dependent oxidoreductase [Dehalococcoidia bacterium]|nr:LLM class flavin-dependent oxidoreductase [Dehalococcoidia bacterium]